jgi:hypothetical protein
MEAQESEHNPYAPPASLAPASRPGVRDWSGRARWAVLWGGVYAANMVVPLLFGWTTTARGGRIGLVLAVVLLYWIVFWVGGKSRDLRSIMLSGGGLVALSQLFPMLQIAAGLIALGIVGKLTGVNLGPDDSPIEGPVPEHAGFLATLITGAILLAGAACAGLASWWFAGLVGWRVRSTDSQAAT